LEKTADEGVGDGVGVSEVSFTSTPAAPEQEKKKQHQPAAEKM